MTQPHDATATSNVHEVHDKPPSSSSSSRKRHSLTKQSSSKRNLIIKLNAQQVAAVLKGFWNDLLQNNLKNVRKCLQENHQKMNFNAAHYTPNADGTPLHLCAQFGFLDMAKMLIEEFELDVNVVNKVGSTPLHVACKFQQEAVVTYLFQRQVRLLVPDTQHRVAFDVASFGLLENCILVPLRQEQQDASNQYEELEKRQHNLKDQFQREMNQLNQRQLRLEDIWSQLAIQESMLKDTMVMEATWANQVQDAKHLVGSKLHEYKHAKEELEALEEAFANGDLKFLQQAQTTKQQATNALHAHQKQLEEAKATLAVKQRALDAQFGLLETAQRQPNDVHVQIWMLSMVITMVEDTLNHTTNQPPLDIGRLLLREEMVQTIQSTMERFPMHREVQLYALRALCKLTTYQTTLPKHQSDQFTACMWHVHVPSTLQKTLTQFPQDLTLLELVLALICHCITSAMASDGQFTKQVLAFCCQFKQLDQLCQYLQDPKASMALRRDAALLCFHLARYNSQRLVRETRLPSLAVQLLVQYLETTDLDRDTDHDTDQTSISLDWTKHVLGLMTLLHVPPPNQQLEKQSKTSPSKTTMSQKTKGPGVTIVTLDHDPVWPTLDASVLLKTIGTVTTINAGLLYWLFRCLRNLILHHGEQAKRFRMELFTLECLDVLTTVIPHVLTPQENKLTTGSIGSSVAICAGLELMQLVFIQPFFNREGRIYASDPLVLDFLIDMVQLEVQQLPQPASPIRTALDRLSELSKVFQVLALALSDARNVEYVNTTHRVVLNQLVQTAIVPWLQHQLNQEKDDLVQDTIVHLTSVYVRLYQHERDADDCRTLGIHQLLQTMAKENDPEQQQHLVQAFQRLLMHS